MPKAPPEGHTLCGVHREISGTAGPSHTSVRSLFSNSCCLYPIPPTLAAALSFQISQDGRKLPLISAPVELGGPKDQHLAQGCLVPISAASLRLHYPSVSPVTREPLTSLGVTSRARGHSDLTQRQNGRNSCPCPLHPWTLKSLSQALPHSHKEHLCSACCEPGQARLWGQGWPHGGALLWGTAATALLSRGLGWGTPMSTQGGVISIHPSVGNVGGGILALCPTPGPSLGQGSRWC